MAEITAALVKELREKTGAGMMDCKAALNETQGDMEAAVDWLRTKGLAKAAKKAGRIAADGLVALAVGGTTGAVVEINSETDFVARNESFQDFAAQVAEIALAQGGDIDKVLVATFPGTDGSVQDQATKLIATIGENISVRRAAALTVGQGAVVPYVHNQVVPGRGKIGVLVALESAGNREALEALGRQIAMHVAAASPLALTAEEVDPAAVERERQVFSEQARASGKPDAIIEKMVEGRLRKFYEEVVLLQQVFVIDGETPIGKVVKAAEAGAGAPIALKGFVRFALGEGIDKKETDFAAEVAALSKS